MQTRDEQIESARTIRNYLGMSATMAETLRDLAQIQPRYRRQWNDIANNCETGGKLADGLEKHKMWPDSMIAAIRAGENAGKIEALLDSIGVFNRRMKDVTGVVSKKLLTPSIFLVAGILIFIGFMTFVLPGVSKPLKKKRDRQGLIAISDTFVDIYQHHLLEVGLIAGTLVIGLVFIFRAKTTRDAMFSFFDRLPVIGDGMREVYYGFWLQFMAILDTAGDIRYQDMVKISSSIIPAPYRHSMDLMLAESGTGGGLVYAVDDKRWAAGDPRFRWPKMFRGVLRQSAKLGQIQKAFEQASGPLIEEGLIKIEKTLGLFNLVALMAAAGGILTPMAGMMLVQLDVVNKMR